MELSQKAGELLRYIGRGTVHYKNGNIGPSWPYREDPIYLLAELERASLVEGRAGTFSATDAGRRHLDTTPDPYPYLS